MAASTAMASSTLRQQVVILPSNALLNGSAVSTRRTGPCYASAIATSSPVSQPPTCSASISTRTGVEETQTPHRREGVVSRRETLSAVSSAAMAAALLALAPALPAEAKSLEERYAEETTAVIDKIRYTLNLDKTDPGKPEAVATLKAASVDWVAKYRREKKVAGKPSFSNMYSVLNAISGHYNSFGIGYPIPAKRKDRILQEVDDTEKALAKGR